MTFLSCLLGVYGLWVKGDDNVEYNQKKKKKFLFFSLPCIINFVDWKSNL